MDLKPGKWWGFVEGWDLCAAPTFPCTARAFPALHLQSLALFSTIERRLVSGAGKCCQPRRFSILDPRFLTLHHFQTSWTRLRLELGPEVSSRLHFRPFYSGRDTWLECLQPKSFLNFTFHICCTQDQCIFCSYMQTLETGDSLTDSASLHCSLF